MFNIGDIVILDNIPRDRFSIPLDEWESLKGKKLFIVNVEDDSIKLKGSIFYWPKENFKLIKCKCNIWITGCKCGIFKVEKQLISSLCY